MSQTKQVMIVEDNPQIVQSIIQFFHMKNQVRICCAASDSLEAIEALNNSVPDAIILDLVMPNSDGFVLLEHLKNSDYEKKPVVIIVSSISHQAVIQRACQLGASYFIAKPFSMEVLHKRVLNFLDEQPEGHEPVQAAETGFDQELSSLLLKIGIPPQNKGFRYISEAAKLIMAKPDLVNNLTKKLYPDIGEIYHTGSNNVERGIRHAIEVAWNSGKLQNINKITDRELIDLKYKPTNGEFISIVHQLLSPSRAAPPNNGR